MAHQPWMVTHFTAGCDDAEKIIAIFEFLGGGGKRERGREEGRGIEIEIEIEIDR